ncbi:MAG: phytanoyl-CoA dioxygenase family protein [Myxococcota bacterium]
MKCYRTRFRAPRDGIWSDAMHTTWRRDGVLVLEGFATERQCGELRRRMAQLVEGFDPVQQPLSVFTTRDDAHADRDALFLASGEEVAFFFEEDALDVQGRLRWPKEEALNKVGHALHEYDPVFERFSRRADLARLAHEAGVRRPKLVQSMYIFKHPRRGSEVRWHQDGAFLRTTPLSVVGFWLALDDATLDNGCLQALPGMHREPLRTRFVRRGWRADLDVLDPRPWPEAQAVALDVPRGTLVMLHGALPHASGHNHSDQPRAAYALHVVDGTARYAADNWLQRTRRPFRGFQPTSDVAW